MRIGKCAHCRQEAWVNVSTRSGNEYCAGCWQELAIPEDTGRPAIRRLRAASGEPSPWREVAVRALEDAPADLEVA